MSENNKLDDLIRMQVEEDVLRAEQESAVEPAIQANEFAAETPPPPQAEPQPTASDEAMNDFRSENEPAGESRETEEPTKSRLERLKEKAAKFRIDSFAAGQRARDKAIVWNAARKEKKLNTKKLEEEAKVALAEEIKAKAEFVGTDIEKFCAQLELVEEQEISSIKTINREWLKNAYNGYKKLGEMTLIGKNKFKISARLGASMGLLGAGFATAAFAPAVAPIAIGIKRGFSGSFTAFASYDLVMMGREKWNRSSAEKQLETATTPEQVRELMIKMRIRAGLDGKNLADLRQDDLYTKLSNKFKELLVAETQNIGLSPFVGPHIERMENEAHAAGKTSELKDNPEYKELKRKDAEWRERILTSYFKDSLDNVGGIVKKEAKNEKLKRYGLAVGAGGFGTFVGGGWMAQMAGDKINWMTDKMGIGKAAVSATVEETAQPPRISIPETGHVDIEQPKVIQSLSPETLGVEESQVTIPEAGHIDIEQPKVIENLSDQTLGSIDAEKTGSSLDAIATKEIPYHDNAQINPAKKPEVEFTQTPEKIEFGKDISIQATERGLEGALLDLKNTDPDRYGKMIEWLKAKDPGVTNDGALVHRFMLDFAKDHGMSVDGGGQDLSKILKGDMIVGSDGSIGMREIDFMPEKPPTAPEISSPAPETEAQIHPDQEVFKQNLNVEFPQPGQAPANMEFTPNIDVDINPVEEAAVESSPSEETASTTVDQTAATVESVTTASAEKASQAVEVVLGSESKKFLKEMFGLNPTTLNRIAKRSISQFLEDYQMGNARFKKDYLKFFESISDSVKSTGSQIPVRQFVLAAANEYKK